MIVDWTMNKEDKVIKPDNLFIQLYKVENDIRFYITEMSHPEELRILHNNIIVKPKGYTIKFSDIFRDNKCIIESWEEE